MIYRNNTDTVYNVRGNNNVIVMVWVHKNYGQIRRQDLSAYSGNNNKHDVIMGA